MSSTTTPEHHTALPPLTRLAYSASAALSAILFLLGVRYYLVTGFFADDAFISLRYAQRMAQGKGLSWNDGEFVEGYSNLLWVLAEAGTMAIGMDPVVGMRLLSFLGSGVALLCLGLFFRPSRTGRVLPGAFAMLAFASTQLTVIATATGFETPFVFGFLSLALLILLQALEEPGGIGRRSCLLAGIPLGLLALTRPDGALFTGALAMGLVLLPGTWRSRIGRAITVTVLPAICVAGQLAFRLWYHHDWVPNTARVKLPGGLERAGEGLVLAIEGLIHQRGVWVVSLLALAVVARPAARLHRPTVVLTTTLLGWTGYLVYVGGGGENGRCFLVVTVLLSIWLAGLGLLWLVELLHSKGKGPLWLGLLTLLLGLTVAWLRAEQWQDPHINGAIHNQFKWQKKGILLADLWGTAFAARGAPSIAVNTAGAIPYYTGWTTIDMLGLNDRWIATHPPDESIWELVGHTHGDGAYVIDRAPDIVFFGVHWGTWGGVFTGGKQMHADPRFYEQYRFVELERLDPRSPRVKQWLRLESPILGLIRSEDRIEIPPWFVNNQTSATHRIEDAVRLPLAQGELATAAGITVPAGRWALTARFAGEDQPSTTTALRASDGSALLTEADGTVVVKDEVELDLELRVDHAAGTLMLEALVLERR